MQRGEWASRTATSRSSTGYIACLGGAGVRGRAELARGAARGFDALLLGRTVLPPGARHEPHSHPNCDEFLFVVSGHGTIYTDDGEEPVGVHDVVFTTP